MNADPARILILSERSEDLTLVATLLEESGLAAHCRRIPGIADLQRMEVPGGTELILYRPGATGDDDRELARHLEGLDHPPGLLLLVNGVAPGHYTRAGLLGAADTLDLEVPAQIDFALRRELGHVRLRRQYARARERLEQERVIDDAEFAEPDAGEHIPPLVEFIDAALREDRMELLFQPILSASDDGHESHELFLRIRTENGHLMPEEFLPTAHRYGLMPAIDRWVVEEALQHFRRHQAVLHKRGGPRLRFFVNLSSHTLVDPVAIDEIVQSIADADLPPGSFVIEIDKNTILSRLQKSKSLNRDIKHMQLQFAIDHYDISDNSLNYLKHLDLDYIKLTRTLVHNIDRAPHRREQIEAIVARAHDAGIRVIASQIEYARELAVMYERGVDCFQGYVIAQPGTKPAHGIGLDEMVS